MSKPIPMIRIAAYLFMLSFTLLACKKEEAWQTTLQKLEGSWKVINYTLDGQNIDAQRLQALRFTFETCNMPKYTFCNGYFTNNNQQESLFAYKVNEAANQIEINFAALQYANIQAQWQAEKNKHTFTYQDAEAKEHIIVLGK